MKEIKELIEKIDKCENMAKEWIALGNVVYASEILDLRNGFIKTLKIKIEQL